MKKYGSILVALLGVVAGVLLALTFPYVNGTHGKLKVDYNQWRKLNLILQQVERNYVDSIDKESVTDAAVVAALSALDPHSIYLPPVDLQETETELAGNFDGIGIQFNVPNDTAVVLEVIAGGPSEKVGLQSGDRIIKVDDKVIAGVKFPQDSMVRRMKGPAGTKVTIHVERAGTPISFEITRGKIPVHCVDAYFMINDTTGFIRLSKFSRTTFSEVSAASADLLSKGMRKLVLDLRDNTGGYFDQACLLANMFLGQDEEIVYLEGRHRTRKDYKADGKGLLSDIGISVLINESSASSSEIFAGAIQDNDRGVIVGRRSFGKGLVQEPVFFTDGSGIRITVARFYTPSGRCIQKPYSKDYAYDIYKRYQDGEMFAQDSIKVNEQEKYHTRGGRVVYGGGGIIPDVFVPMDTTKATKFYIACNRKTTQMRFASKTFDRYRNELRNIDSFEALDAFYARVNLAGLFRNFAASQDGITASDKEWEETLPYLMPQLKALVSRYTPLGENAFYKLYLEIDDVVKAAV